MSPAFASEPSDRIAMAAAVFSSAASCSAFRLAERAGGRIEPERQHG